MPSSRVVEDLEILEEFGARRGAGGPGGVVDELDFNVAKKLSATALSQPLPRRLTDARRHAWESTWRRSPRRCK